MKNMIYLAAFFALVIFLTSMSCSRSTYARGGSKHVCDTYR